MVQTGKRGPSGRPLSMVLYLIFINDLLNELCASNLGITILNMKCGSPAHADDVALVALYPTCLNGMLDICLTYSRKWRYDFNEDKTVYVKWGKNSESHSRIVFGDRVLEPQSKCKHMGVLLCNENKIATEEICRRIGVAKATLGAARGLGSRSIPCDPQVLSKIYWSVVIPQMLYGYDVTPISSNNVSALEEAHRQNCKLVQGVASDVPNPAPLAAIGWISIESYILMVKILFLIRTLCLPVGNFYREFVIRTLEVIMNHQYVSQRSPLISMYNAAKKFNIDVIIKQRLHDNNTFGTYNEWKSIVKREIWRVEVAKWKATCLLYHSLDTYSTIVTHIGINIWWKIASKVPHMTNKISGVMSVIMNSQPRGMFCKRNGKKCTVCDIGIVDSVQHVLFICPQLQTREKYLEKLIQAMSPSLASSFANSDENTKTYMLLSAYGCAYPIDEWLDLYCETASYIYSMYASRKEAHTQLYEVLS